MVYLICKINVFSFKWKNNISILENRNYILYINDFNQLIYDID